MTIAEVLPLLPSRTIGNVGVKGAPLGLLLPGHPSLYLRLVKTKASALIVFNYGRHTTELMSTKNLLHKSHSNNEHRRKVSVEVLFSSKMLLTLHQ